MQESAAIFIKSWSAHGVVLFLAGRRAELMCWWEKVKCGGERSLSIDLALKISLAWVIDGLRVREGFRRQAKTRPL